LTHRRGSPSVVPPRWVFRLGWALHRAGYAITGGRLGLRTAGGEQLGTLRLHTLGRRSGQERTSMLYYLQDGEHLVVAATNAGADAAPSWWLNLQATPKAVVDLPEGPIWITTREADTAERERLWPRLVARHADYQKLANATERHIPMVILEPTDERADA
jgi:deazaflavin-dependent oxidoreductase (nitroreductase family)